MQMLTMSFTDGSTATLRLRDAHDGVLTDIQHLTRVGVASGA
jgi:hypothetical protein